MVNTLRCTLRNGENGDFYLNKKTTRTRASGCAKDASTRTCPSSTDVSAPFQLSLEPRLLARHGAALQPWGYRRPLPHALGPKSRGASPCPPASCLSLQLRVSTSIHTSITPPRVGRACFLKLLGGACVHPGLRVPEGRAKAVL